MRSAEGLGSLVGTAIGMASLALACSGSTAHEKSASPDSSRAEPEPPPARPAEVEPTPADAGCPDFTLPRSFWRTESPVLAHGIDACIWRAFEGAPDARELLERACAAKSGRGCLNLGMLLLAHPPGTPDATCASTEVAPVKGCSKMTAIDAFHRGCERGEPYACEREASHYFAGIGVSRDPERASGLFEQACNGSISSSCRYAAPYTSANERPECKKDADCVLTNGLNCAGPCGECTSHPLTFAVDQVSLKQSRQECEKEQREIEGERRRGMPSPDCAACPPPPIDPPPVQPTRAICAAGVCVAI